MQPWWTPADAGMIGGVIGVVVGLLGAAVGTLAGIFAPRGQLRQVVLGLHAGAIVAGGCLLVAGITAATLGQPYAVWYPLVLGGGIASVVMGSLLPVVLARYRQADARRLAAEQFRRGSA
jgi:hypothetical protein